MEILGELAGHPVQIKQEIKEKKIKEMLILLKTNRSAIAGS